DAALPISHTLSHTHTHTHTLTHSNTHTHRQTQKQTHTQTDTQTHTLRHTHTRTHTHTHTHTQPRLAHSPPSCPCLRRRLLTSEMIPRPKRSLHSAHTQSIFLSLPLPV